MTIKGAFKEASLALKSPKEASILLSHVSELNQTEIIINENQKLKNYSLYQDLIKRRLSHEPIEYITNKVSFYSQEFFIKKGALIPRPETEILIDKTIEISKRFNSKLKVAEIGTGSGIISVMLAKLINDIQIIATDISQEAIDIAKINAKQFNVEKKIKFMKTNYLDNISDEFDMIISNPPYIANDFKLEKNLSYEPDNALFGGVIGDEILKDIIDIWIKKQAPYLICEIGYDQKENLKKYLKTKGIKEYSFYKDLSGFNRGFVAKGVLN